MLGYKHNTKKRKGRLFANLEDVKFFFPNNNPQLLYLMSSLLLNPPPWGRMNHFIAFWQNPLKKLFDSKYRVEFKFDKILGKSWLTLNIGLTLNIWG